MAVDADRVETNIVIFDVRDRHHGEEFGRRTLERSGVRFSVLGPTLVRAVTHLDLPPDGVERALAAARAALRVEAARRNDQALEGRPRAALSVPPGRFPVRDISKAS